MSSRDVSIKFYPNQYDVSQSIKPVSKKRLKVSHQLHDLSHNDNINISSIKSSFKNLSHYENEKLVQNSSQLPLNYFQQKYGLNANDINAQEEMKRTENQRNDQIDSLRIYRNQLKLISNTHHNYNFPPKVSMSTLKRLANMQSKLEDQKCEIDKGYKHFTNQLELMSLYLMKIAKNNTDQSSCWAADIIDVEKQQEIIIKNLQMETIHLIKQLSHENLRNNKEIRQAQQQILSLRIDIKQKQDRLRDLKAKMCTMYIKLHSRNDSRTGSKSRDKNMSISIKKFNNRHHSAIQQAFVGNSLFKNYSKQLLEKVNSQEQAHKIRFYYYDTQYQGKSKNKNNSQKQKFTFQCIYKQREGLVHSQNAKEGSQQNYDEITRDKISQQSCVFEEVQVKYLLSMKFFYKSKIVGVECRLKTDRGNRHIQIGCCDANVEHQLLTLINKNIITLGSFWHGKQMIGVSIWFKNRQRISKGNQLHMNLRSKSRKSITNYSTQKKINNKKKVKNDRVLQEYYV